MVLAAFLLTYATWFLTTYDGARSLQHLGPTALLPARYLTWLNNVLQGDLGFSLRTGQPVLQSILSRLPATLLLVVPAFILQELIGVALGMFAAVRYQHVIDRVITSAVFIVSSIPPFLLGLYTLVLFSVDLHWVPFGGLTNFVNTPPFNTPAYWAYFHANIGTAILELARHLLLPVLTLAVIGAAADSQLVRVATLEVLNQEYIRAARARGLPERLVIWKHALRNAIIPVITNIGVQLPRLVFAAAIIEYAFGIPGLGKLFIDAVFTPAFQGGLNGGPPAPPDLNIATGYFLVLGLFTLLVSALTDITYAYADPRIRAGTERAPAAVAIAPTWTWALPRRTLVKTRRFRLTVGQAGIAALVVAVVTLGAIYGRSLIAPQHPPFTNVNGDWVSVVTHKDTFIGHSDLFLVLSINAQGQLRGSGNDCSIAYGAQQTALAVTGYTDGTTLHLSLIGQGEQYILLGDFPKTAASFSMAGGFSGSGFQGGSEQVSMSFQHGTHSAWQTLCKQSSNG